MEPSELEDSPSSTAAARWLLTLDRISMVGTWSVMHTIEDVEVTESGTQAILVGGSATTGSSVPINPHAIPRLTLERIIGSRFILGLGASLYKHGGDWDAQSGGRSASGEGAKSWLVALSPRIGYQIPVTDDAGIGLRAGVTWSQQRERSSLVRSNVKVGTFDLALSWTYWVFEHLGVVGSFDLCLPIGGIRYLDYDEAFASKLSVEPHTEDNLKLRVIALQLGAQARF